MKGIGNQRIGYLQQALRMGGLKHSDNLKKNDICLNLIPVCISNDLMEKRRKNDVDGNPVYVVTANGKRFLKRLEGK